MADGDGQQALRYSAFISYSHTDSAFARRLHRKLENYRLPRRLAEQRGESGPAARRLRPIFRDREELPAAADLTQAVRRALSESSYLIVICSPHSSTSAWVAREIELFRDLHGDGGILAALVDGATDDAFRCLFGGTKDGGQSPEPLAADFRRDGDGGRLAYLKLVAALAGVRLDSLIQRDAQRRVRQATTVGASALLGMTAMGVLALIAINARNAAQQERARGEALVDFLLSDLRQNVKSAGRLDILYLVNQGALNYYAHQNLNGLPTSALMQRAKLLQAIGDDDETRGDLMGARAQFEEAQRITAALLQSVPNDPNRIYSQAQSEYWLGSVDWRLGNDVEAMAEFKMYEQMAHRLVAISPDNADWIMEEGDAKSNLGMFELRRSIDTYRAGRLFQTASADFERVEAIRPRDREIKIQVADGYAWLADVERLRGDYAGAFGNRSLQQEMLNRLLALDPRDFEVRSDLVSNKLGFARIAEARGQLVVAVSILQKDLDDAAALSRENPQDKYFADEVRALDLFEVRAWLMMPKSERPPSNIIARLLGNCQLDLGRQDGDELKSFCLVLNARFFSASGDLHGALAQLSKIPADPSGDLLTSRWLINLREEAGVTSIHNTSSIATYH